LILAIARWSGEIVARLKEARPDGITGYAGVLSRVADELGTYAYVLRVLAFALILWGIVDKNVFSARRRR